MPEMPAGIGIPPAAARCRSAGSPPSPAPLSPSSSEGAQHGRRASWRGFANGGPSERPRGRLLGEVHALPSILQGRPPKKYRGPPPGPKHQQPSMFGRGIRRDMPPQGHAPHAAGAMAASSSSGPPPQAGANPYVTAGVTVPMGPHRFRPFPCVTLMTDEQIHNLLYGILFHRPHVATEWAHGVAHARPGIWIPQAIVSPSNQTSLR